MKKSAQLPGCWFAGTTKSTSSTPTWPTARPSNAVYRAGVFVADTVRSAPWFNEGGHGVGTG